VELIHRGYESARKGCQMIRLGHAADVSPLAAAPVAHARVEDVA
jgi:hypothetical protein